jgi:hypothetical protein
MRLSSGFQWLLFVVVVASSALLVAGTSTTSDASDDVSYKRARSVLLARRAETEQLQAKIALEKSEKEDHQVESLMKKAKDIVAKISALRKHAAQEQAAKLSALHEAKAARAAEVAAKAQLLRQEQAKQHQRAKAMTWAHQDVHTFFNPAAAAAAAMNAENQKMAWNKMQSAVHDDLGQMLERDEEDAANAGIVKRSAIEQGREDVEKETNVHHDQESDMIATVSNFFLSAEREALEAVSHMKESSAVGKPGPPGPPGPPGKTVKLPEDAAVPIIVSN